MESPGIGTTCQWMRTGNEVFPEMLRAIDAAAVSVCLETYIFAPGPLGERFRDALVRARRRGAAVRVLVDAVGSIGLSSSFWDPLAQAGGEARWFNPVTLKRFWFRNHRKLLVCDERVAFVGGFNIAPEFEGDGIASGWRDVGLKVEGPLAVELKASFEEMFARADFQHKRFMGLRRFDAKKSVARPGEQLLFSGPGRGRSPVKAALRADLARARDARIVMAYFLPTWRLRHDLARVVRRGGRVQLILAGKSDVSLSQLAARSLYRRFLRSGLEIYEYEPQILHAKLIVIDDVVYVGSSNLDQRSLHINYELMLRFEGQRIAGQAREVFTECLGHCRPIERESWRRTRTLWQRIKQRLAFILLARIDPYLARRQWQALPD
jgi:cardiolipin synthase